MKKSLMIFLPLLLVSAMAFAGSIQKGEFQGDVKSEGWTLNAGSGSRSHIVFVKFDKPFDTPPQVVVSMTGSSSAAAKDGSTNIAVSPDRVTRDGFVVKVSTWGESKVFAVYGSWIAFTDK